MKIAYISRHPAPYRDPIMSKLGQVQAVSVEFFNEYPEDSGHGFWDIKKHGYNAKALYPSTAGRVRRFLHLIRHFVFGKYDFVLFSVFLDPEMIAAMFIAALFRKKYGFVPDTVKEGTCGVFKHWFKSLIVTRAALIFVPGEAGARFWQVNYRIPRERLIKGAYALDGNEMARKIACLRNRRLAIRSEYGIAPSDVVFLMVANMIPSRHYPITTKAFSKFVAGRKDLKFVIVGKGPDQVPMKEYALQHSEIVVVDGVPFDKMLELYAVADVYVHGGTEPASTALVIGAIAGLPLVSSDAVGCSADVLQDGESGVKVDDYLSVDAWMVAFGRMMAFQSQWAEMGKKGRVLSRALDVEQVADNFIDRLRQIDGQV